MAFNEEKLTAAQQRGSQAEHRGAVFRRQKARPDRLAGSRSVINTRCCSLWSIPDRCSGRAGNDLRNGKLTGSAFHDAAERLACPVAGPRSRRDRRISSPRHARPANSRTVPLLVIVPLPPPTTAELPRPTSMANTTRWSPMASLDAVTSPPPLMSSIPAPVEPIERLGRVHELRAKPVDVDDRGPGRGGVGAPKTNAAGDAANDRAAADVQRGDAVKSQAGAVCQFRPGPATLATAGKMRPTIEPLASLTPPPVVMFRVPLSLTLRLELACSLFARPADTCDSDSTRFFITEIRVRAADGAAVGDRQRITAAIVA